MKAHIESYRTASKCRRILYIVARLGILQTTLCTAIQLNNVLYVLRLSTTGDGNHLFNGF